MLPNFNARRLTWPLEEWVSEWVRHLLQNVWQAKTGSKSISAKQIVWHKQLSRSLIAWHLISVMQRMKTLSSRGIRIDYRLQDFTQTKETNIATWTSTRWIEKVAFTKSSNRAWHQNEVVRMAFMVRKRICWRKTDFLSLIASLKCSNLRKNRSRACRTGIKLLCAAVMRRCRDSNEEQWAKFLNHWS